MSRTRAYKKKTYSCVSVRCQHNITATGQTNETKIAENDNVFQILFPSVNTNMNIIISFNSIQRLKLCALVYRIVSYSVCTAHIVKTGHRTLVSLALFRSCSHLTTMEYGWHNQKNSLTRQHLIHRVIHATMSVYVPFEFTTKVLILICINCRRLITLSTQYRTFFTEFVDKEQRDAT